MSIINIPMDNRLKNYDIYSRITHVTPSLSSVGNFYKCSKFIAKILSKHVCKTQVALLVLEALQLSMRSAILYTMDQYGMDGYKALVEGSKAAGVCFTSTISIPLSGLSNADYQVRNLFMFI